MNNEKLNYITRAGLEVIKKRYHKVKHEDLPYLLSQMKGNIHENFAAEQARRDLLVLDGLIKSLEPYLQNPIIIDDMDINGNVVGVGTRVFIQETGEEVPETYIIIGEGEAEPSKGSISWKSPLAQAMYNKKEGEIFQLHFNSGGSTSFTIKKIEKAFGN